MPPDFTKQPAQQTAIGNQAFAFLPGWSSPSRGLITQSSLFALPSDAAAALKNLRWNGKVWTTQQIGYANQRAAVFNGGAAFKGMGIHYLATGIAKFVQQVGTQVQTYDPTLTPADTEKVLFTASALSIPSMCSLSPSFFLYANGVDTPQKWDGVTWQQAESFPVTEPGGTILATPSLVGSFQNRSVFSGFPSDPYGVLVSNFGAPTTFTFSGTSDTIGGYFRVPSAYGPVTAVRSFRLSMQTNQEVLLVGCQNGLVMMNGTGASTFEIVPITNRFGIVSQNAWMQLDNDTYVLCTDGIRKLQSNVYFSNLISSVLSYPIHDLFSNISTSQGAQAFVIDNPALAECYWYFSSGFGAQNTSAIYMSYREIAGGTVKFAQRVFPSLALGVDSFAPSCGISFGGSFWTGGYTGRLRQEWTGNTFAGQGVDWQYDSPLFTPPSLAEEASARAFWILTEGDGQALTASGIVHSSANNGQGLIRKVVSSQNYSSSGSSTPALGSWVLDVDPFGNLRWDIFEFNPKHAGRGWQVSLTGNTGNGDCSFIGIYSTLIAGGTRE